MTKNQMVLKNKENKDKSDALLIALRKIIRAMDLHSKQLAQKFGLTAPQIILLNSLHQNKTQNMNCVQLAESISLSKATVTSILDRLCEKGYIIRQKSESNKRNTYLKITKKTEMLFQKNPPLLQERFLCKFTALKQSEQSRLIAAFEQVAEMMGAKEIDAAPLLVNTDIHSSRHFSSNPKTSAK